MLIRVKACNSQLVNLPDDSKLLEKLATSLLSSQPIVVRCTTRYVVQGTLVELLKRRHC